MLVVAGLANCCCLLDASTTLLGSSTVFTTGALLFSTTAGLFGSRLTVSPFSPAGSLCGETSGTTGGLLKEIPPSAGRLTPATTGLSRPRDEAGLVNLLLGPITNGLLGELAKIGFWTTAAFVGETAPLLPTVMMVGLLFGDRIAGCPSGLLIFGSKTGLVFAPPAGGFGRRTGLLIGFGMIIWLPVVFGMIFC